MSFKFVLYLNTGSTLETEVFDDIDDLYRAYGSLVNEVRADSNPFAIINHRYNPYEWVRGKDAPKFHYLNRSAIAAVTIVEDEG